jgi:Holliday junction resolvase RusA-like endonuclease
MTEEDSIFDFMEAVSASGRSIAFVVKGDPPSQERARIAAIRDRASDRMRAHLYDPSSRLKIRFRSTVQRSMVQYGLRAPYFAADEAVTVHVKFVLPRRRQDLVRHDDGTVTLAPDAQRFPRNKDVDNMLKFVMDALEGVIYHNDVIITKVIVSKIFPAELDSTGWTDIHLSSSPQEPPPVAGAGWV